MAHLVTYNPFLHVKIKDVRNAPHANCFVRVFTCSRGFDRPHRWVQTNTIDLATRDKWDENFKFAVSPHVQKIVFELYKEGELCDLFVGSFDVDLENIQMERPGIELPPTWYTLYRNNRNMCFLEVYMAFLSDSRGQLDMGSPYLVDVNAFVDRQFMRRRSLPELPFDWETVRRDLGPLYAWEGHLSYHATPFSRRYADMLENIGGPCAETSTLILSRENIVTDSLLAIQMHNSMDFWKGTLRVEFIGERGLDNGGITREWCNILSQKVFDPSNGLFQHTADKHRLEINPSSGCTYPNHILYFTMIGMLCALGIFHGAVLNAALSPVFYKSLQRKTITLADVKVVDASFAQSLEWVMANDVDAIGETFSIDEMLGGQVVHHELVINGDAIAVSNRNKPAYVNRMIQRRFVERVEWQMQAVIEGFEKLLPIAVLQPFSADELEIIICGWSTTDLPFMRDRTVYIGYHEDDPVIQWLWKYLEQSSESQRSRYLYFITGSGRIPPDRTACKFCITIAMEDNPLRLAISHTCFSQLNLPQYRSYEELERKLSIAINECEGFEGVD